MRAEPSPFGVDDVAALPAETLALEERAVVVASEEACLLALGTPRGREPRSRGLVARLVLRLLAEWEADPLEKARIDGCEHVRLILLLVHGARDEREAVALDDPRVVARPELACSRTLGEGDERVEAKRAVAAHARVRRLPGLVARARTDRRSCS